MHLKTRSFWKSSKSVCQWPGSVSLKRYVHNKSVLRVSSIHTAKCMYTVELGLVSMQNAANTSTQMVKYMLATCCKPHRQGACTTLPSCPLSTVPFPAGHKVNPSLAGQLFDVLLGTFRCVCLLCLLFCCRARACARAQTYVCTTRCTYTLHMLSLVCGTQTYVSRP